MQASLLLRRSAISLSPGPHSIEGRLLDLPKSMCPWQQGSTLCSPSSLFLSHPLSSTIHPYLAISRTVRWPEMSQQFKLWIGRVKWSWLQGNFQSVCLCRYSVPCSPCGCLIPLLRGMRLFGRDMENGWTGNRAFQLTWQLYITNTLRKFQGNTIFRVCSHSCVWVCGTWVRIHFLTLWPKKKKMKMRKIKLMTHKHKAIWLWGDRRARSGINEG